MNRKDNNKGLFSFNKQDEYYTPEVLVKPILKYLKPNSKIWCPFDTEESEFVKLLKKAGHIVNFTHIEDNHDFFISSIEEQGIYFENIVSKWRKGEKPDYIISNPPFSKKKEVFKKLYELGIPFAMVMGLQTLNTQEIANLFIDKDLQLLMFDKRISYDGKSSSFASGYFCWKILPKNLIVEKLKHTNTGKNFKPSGMFLEKLKNET